MGVVSEQLLNSIFFHLVSVITNRVCCVDETKTLFELKALMQLVNLL